MRGGDGGHFGRGLGAGDIADQHGGADGLKAGQIGLGDDADKLPALDDRAYGRCAVPASRCSTSEPMRRRAAAIAGSAVITCDTGVSTGQRPRPAPGWTGRAW